MARPSINHQRSEEILEAYERCIAKFGVHGATLAAIAQEAGLARPLVRYHVGNQDALLQKALQRFIQRTQKLYQQLPPQSFADIDEFIEILFCNNSPQYINDVQIAAALISASANNSTIKVPIKSWLSDSSQWFYQHISHHYPKASEQQKRAVSAGVMGISFNVDSLAMLEDAALHLHSKQAAQILIKSLDSV